MATSKVIFSYPSGETLVVRALPATGNAYLFTSTAVAEAPANSGLYTATFTELVALSGAYRIVVTLSGTGVASYQARWTGSDGETVVATEFVDVSQIATAADLATIDTNVDSILVDTGTTIPAQISGLNNFNPASDTVANVTLVATTTTNSDMRGTDNAALASALSTVDGIVDSILIDTGTTIPAQISALNNVAATDIVSAGAITTLAGAVVNVDLVDVCSVNSDMRGTNGANTVVPVDVSANVAAVKAKTDQLAFTVSNQVDANALTGGTSPSAVADAVWDEAASGHNVSGSFGKFIRQMKEGLIVEEATVNDASATTTSFVTALPSAVDDFYNDDTMVFVSGSLTGQSRIIADYNGTTKAVTFDEVWTFSPANGDEFILLAGHNNTLTQIENQIWNAVEANHQITGSTGKALSDAGGGGGGDATAAKQNEILGKLAASSVVYTNPSSPNKLTLIRGDAYDDAAENNGKLTWATGKTLTGATVRFTIRDASDNILIDQTTAGVSTAVNSQTAEVSLTSAATALLTVATTNKFDAEAYWAADNRWTFARGQCTVLEDQTRT